MSEKTAVSPLKLGVNIDHVATLRQARYALMPGADNEEPSLLAAAHEVEAAGADSITIHLRQDRRHIQDRDVYELREKIHTLMNLEMGNTPEILKIALEVEPAYVCLVPESREEITTEGGLNVRESVDAIRDTVSALQENGTQVSLFVDPEIAQIEAAAETGADMIELHTGSFANAEIAGGEDELVLLRQAAIQAHQAGLQVNAGHGITLMNLPRLLQVPHLTELNVGHHLVSRALFLGLSRAVRDFRTSMGAYPAMQAVS
jgi:pyridoxine 5-phosphate synthase